MKKILPKIIIVATITMIIYLFNRYELADYLTLDYIKTNQERFNTLYEASPLFYIAGFFIIYVIMTAISLPGAVILTLLSGALFGLVIGTIVVSFASSIGASLAFLISRFLLKDFFQKKFRNFFEKINQGVEKEGKFYLFTLRLIPAFPFFIINVVMGLTKIDLKSFYWVSQLGMLLGTVVYVNAGASLANVNNLSDILSFNIIISFVLIGIFPIITKKVLEFYNKKKQG